MATSTTNTTASAWGTGFFSSPSDLKTAAGRANGIVTNMAQALDANTSTSIAENFRDAFTLFKLNWSAWYTEHFQAGSVLEEWLLSDLSAELESYENQITTWGQQLAGQGVSVPGGVPGPTSGGLDLLPTGGELIGIGLVALTLIIAWRVL